MGLSHSQHNRYQCLEFEQPQGSSAGCGGMVSVGEDKLGCCIRDELQRLDGTCNKDKRQE